MAGGSVAKRAAPVLAAVALADLARVLGRLPGRDEQAQAQCDEAKAIAERLGATALRVAAENLTVRV